MTSRRSGRQALVAARAGTAKLAVALVVALFAAPPRAFGHAPPEGTGLWWIPARPTPSAGSAAATPATLPRIAERLVIRTNRGLVVEDQAGSSFAFLCNEAMGVSSGEDAPVAVGDEGDLFLATYEEGLVTGTAGLCQWRPGSGPVAGLPAFDVTTVPGVSSTVYMLAGHSDTSTNFFVSRDGSSSWSALATSDIPFTRIRVSPSEPQRVYRTGVGIGPDSRLIHRLSVSEDGGVTTTESRIELGPDELQALVLDVDPTDSRRVYVRVEATSLELPERLIVSDDGGQTFTTALTLVGFNGFAVSRDGMTVWAGGADGLWRSTDRGAHFAAVPTAGITRVGCLALHDERLFACGVTNDRFNVSVSDDRGDSFQTVVAFSQVTDIIACPDSSPVAAACEASMAHWRSEVSSFAPTTGTTAPQTVASPSATDHVAAAGCRVSPGPGLDAGAPLVLLAFAALIGFAKTRRRVDRVRSARFPKGVHFN